ncbi:MAG: hypothetical protein ACLP1X_20290 [Polyangiaceae bacterium]
MKDPVTVLCIALALAGCSGGVDLSLRMPVTGGSLGRSEAG